tara:strand:+ start:313 stop:645 length:333 start_codon:yes stop_codon:yes gene_type:complete
MIKYFLVWMFFILVTIECASDLCFQHSIKKKDYQKPLFLYIGLGLSVLMGYIYYQILQNYDNLAVPSAIYQCFSVLAVTLVSLVVLKERLTTQKIIGIAVIIVGLGLLQF